MSKAGLNVKGAILQRVETYGPGATGPRDPQERLSELSEILAAGLMRAAARKSSRFSPPAGESSLDFMGAESGHPTQFASEKPE